MNSLRLWLPGLTETWKRPENNRNGGRRNKPAHERAMQELRWQWSFAGRLRLSGPILLTVRVFLPRLKKNCPIVPLNATSGDVDNYQKLVADALQDRAKTCERIAYGNDSELIWGGCGKWWANPVIGTELLLQEIDPHTWASLGAQPIEMLTRWAI